MWQVISKRLDPRSTVLSALSTVLFLSLACSMSMQYGHADTPIAASADLDYQILSDADAQAAIAFGIAFKASQKTIDRRNQKGQDIEASSMLRHGVLPVPSVFAIDRNGVIAFAYSNPNYKVRLPAEELLQVATEIAASK